MDFALTKTLTFTTLWANSEDGKLMRCFPIISLFFFFFSQKIGFDSLCKLSPKETLCLKYQSLIFEENNKKYFRIFMQLQSIVSLISLLMTNSLTVVVKVFSNILIFLLQKCE